VRGLLLVLLANACAPQEESDCVNEFYLDADGDGHGVPEASVTGCIAPTGYDTTHDDCDDGNSAIHPGAEELCNGIDDDCDGAVDPFAPWYVDHDGDGYGIGTRSCDAPPASSAAVVGDCNDADPSVHPDADEVCNGLDDDCDNIVDVDAIDKPTSYMDADGDGYGNDATAYTSCDVPSGTVPIGGDCDDDIAWVNPGADEFCDEIDDDCDALIDIDDPDLDVPLQYADEDDDGFGDPATATTACPIPGWVYDATDCNDAASGVNPGAGETCNSIDDDCDGLTDDDDPSVTGRGLFYIDHDGDGLGASLTVPVLWCVAPSGYADASGDCDDSDASVGGETTMYRDADHDGYGGEADERCPDAASEEWVATGGDCDDSRSGTFPGAPELCNDVDDNCDGLTDDDDPLVEWNTFYADVDGDRYGDRAVTVSSCDAPSGYVEVAGDCQDDDPSIHPRATEYCDEKDNNCDGRTDEAVVYVDWYADEDGDGYGVDSDVVTDCAQQEGYVLTPGDCDDGAATTFPGALETCANPADEDCDGRTDNCADLLLVDRDGDYLGFLVDGGDWNADGTGDLITSVYGGGVMDFDVFFGPRSGEQTVDGADLHISDASLWLDGRVGVGDADGDGDDDLLLEGELGSAAYLFLGPVTSGAELSTDATFEHGSDSVGSVSVVPDHDGDGTPEIVTSSITSGITQRGTVYVAPGNTIGTLSLDRDATYVYEHAPGDRDDLGMSVASAGDTTGDGIAELALGAPGSDSLTVWIVEGGTPPGTYSLSDTPPLASLTSSDSNGFGTTVVAADYDRDGYGDLFVGALRSPALFAFFGPFSGARDSADADAEWIGDRSLGRNFAVDGDVDADGFPDVLLSGDDVAYLQVGETTGVVDVADLPALHPTTHDARFMSVAFLPDWTGDGGSELALGE
jgi:hypothetical protein